MFYNSNSSKVQSETLILLSEVRPTKVTNIHKINKSDIGKKTFKMPYNKNAIFMFDTLRNYLEFEAKIKIDQIQSLNLTFLTYCENLTTEVTTKEVIKTTSFQNYLIDENDKISLHSMAAC